MGGPERAGDAGGGRAAAAWVARSASLGDAGACIWHPLSLHLRNCPLPFPSHLSNMHTLGMKLHLLPVLNPAPPRPRSPLALTWPHSHSGPLAIRSAVRCQSPRFRAPSRKGSCLQGRRKSSCMGRTCGVGRYQTRRTIVRLLKAGLPAARDGGRRAHCRAPAACSESVSPD
jgi:hypothetical protein